ncbi:hypothetical protein NGM10_01060 [Halorussus salilacus]|uniref:DUF7269 family protein n=1 Tax=Halorussus salilacus TaxID=2953750 RepID=UPI00209FC649|nr:hypothetical protein [Halorussus salilacus]USZ68344.1 hypothetical protein NGM10_01060 [Halorussus salilacus]
MGRAVRGRRPPPTDGPAARFARVGDPPETASAADRARTGRSFDRRVATGADGRAASMEAVRSTLAETAAGVHARGGGLSSEEARKAVETGAWTDDPTAAAFLAGEDGPEFPLSARLREWLDPAAERRRRVERTVSAVESALDETEGESP